MMTLQTVMETIARFGQTVINLARQFTLKDLLDVIIVAILLYGIIKLVRETRAGQLVKGLIVLGILFFVSSVFELLMLNAILRMFFQSAFIAAVILFQPEIRKALEQMGNSKVGRVLADSVGIKSKGADKEGIRKVIEAVVGATAALQRLRMGALIVFERDTKLGEIIETGTVVEAEPTDQLIANIFFNKAPLHDGAMIIRGEHIHAAGCILPLTGDSVSAELGTRHRAALGMSENSDALVLVVSEETGQISIAENGRLTRDYSRATLTEALEKALIGEQDDDVSGGRKLLGKLGLRSSRKGGGRDE